MIVGTNLSNVIVEFKHGRLDTYDWFMLATKLLRFEDEMLINFLYGLVDRKEVDGKEIQV